MRAGLLREMLIFKELREHQSETGFVVKEYEEVFRCRGYRRKMTLVVDKDGLSAMEQFIGKTIIFQVRAYPIIKDTQRVVYFNNIYEIKMIDPRTDGTLILTLSRIDT
nr:MAG TPA: Putative head tail adaptor [Caudoviricetes sp.]